MAKPTAAYLQQKLQHFMRLHFVYALVIIAQIIIYDAWALITPESVMKRWLVSAGFLGAVTFLWYLSHNKAKSGGYHRLVVSLILLDIGLASFNIYTQRGMASRAVILYVIPILVSTLLGKVATLATAVIAACAYGTVAVSYFVLNFNEGYKIELYGEVGFYAITLFLIGAALAWRTENKT
jgi:hypothetical protein